MSDTTEAAFWELNESELEKCCAQVAEYIKPRIEAICADLYSEILDSVQAYLAENARFNLSSRLSVARRENTDLRRINAHLLEALRYYADQPLKDGGNIARAAIINAEGPFTGVVR